MDTGRTEARFTRSDALALAAGCVLAFIWRRSVALLGWYESQSAPAEGALIFAAAAWAIVPLLLRKRARLTRGGLFAAVMSLALGLSCAVQTNSDMRLVSCLAMFCTGIWGFLSLAGYRFRGAASLIGPLCAPFSSWPRPFRALGALISRSHPAAAGTLAVLGAGTMLTALYDWLRLGGADGFAAYYSGFADWLLGMGLLVGAVHFGWALVTTLCAYSALRFLMDCASAAGHAAAAGPPDFRPGAPEALLIIALLALLLRSALRLAGDMAELGLTPRRLMAAWFILAAAMALAFALVKALRPGFKPLRRLAALLLVFWLAFSFVNVNYLSARENVDAYLSGRRESVDAVFLQSLGPDAIGPLNDLRQAAAEGRADWHWSYVLNAGCARWQCETSRWAVK